MGEKLSKYPREDQNNLYFSTDISSLSVSEQPLAELSSLEW